jgi:GNAT superfamily N-acetyltransferase
VLGRDVDRPEIETTVVVEVDGDAAHGEIILTGDVVAMLGEIAVAGEGRSPAERIVEMAEVEGVVGKATLAPFCEGRDEVVVPAAENEAVAVDDGLTGCGHDTRHGRHRSGIAGAVDNTGVGHTLRVNVRMAMLEDARELARIRYEFRSGVNPAVESESEFVERCAAWMAERLARDGPWRCWVAEDAGAMQGHLWLCLIEKVPNPAPELEQHAYITNVYVRPDGRGVGVGKALMEAALAFCREVRVDSVILWPTERSRTLYARHGFAAPEDMMEAVLDSGRELH